MDLSSESQSRLKSAATIQRGNAGKPAKAEFGTRNNGDKVRRTRDGERGGFGAMGLKRVRLGIFVF